MKIKRYLLSIICFYIFLFYFPSKVFGREGISLKNLSNFRSSGQLLSSVEAIPEKKSDSLEVENKNEGNLELDILSKSVEIEVNLNKTAKEGGFSPGPLKKNIKESKKMASVKTTSESSRNVKAEENLAEFKEKDLTSLNKKEIEKNENDRIIFNFEGVDLSNVASYIEKVFNVTFITDEAIKPLPSGSKGLSANKISFKTQKPITKKQAWDLFLSFLNMAGLSIIPQDDPRFYRITTIDKVKRAPIPSYIGIDPELLPDNDSIIRYGYFVKDCPLATITNVVNSLRSSNAGFIVLNDHNAFIITDKSYNIKVLMRIVKELDRVTMPQSMSVLRLSKVDAEHVKKIYDNLTKKKDTTVAARLFGPKKPSTALYFPEGAKIIVEPRTNSLVLFGTQDAIRKIEQFIKKHIDVDVSAPYSPLHIYPLKYADSTNIANIMNNLVKFGHQKKGMVGGVRGGDKYFKSMLFTPEKAGNRLVIKGDYDDYLKAKDIIDKLDEAQPQVAVEILILSVDLNDQRELGAQIRNKDWTSSEQNTIGSRVNFQTSGIRLGSNPSGIVENTKATLSGAQRLLGDLISLVTGKPAGNTVLSLGSDRFGVWGIFGMLKTIANTQIISNPFLITTNNTKAHVELGEIKRIISETVIGQTSTDARSDYKATLKVLVTPQINSDGMIVMDLEVSFDTFIEGAEAAKLTKLIKTNVIAADKEILALGGLLRDRVENNISKVPVLGNIPILGWLFKNKKKVKKKEDLLILISAEVIEPSADVTGFTSRHVKEYQTSLQETINTEEQRDPVDRSFFKGFKDEYELESLIFERGQKAGLIAENNVKKSNKRSSKKSKRRRSIKKEKKKKKKSKRRRRRKNKPLLEDEVAHSNRVIAENSSSKSENVKSKQKENRNSSSSDLGFG